MINRRAFNRIMKTERMMIEIVWKEDISLELERSYYDELSATFDVADSIFNAIGMLIDKRWANR